MFSTRPLGGSLNTEVTREHRQVSGAPVSRIFIGVHCLEKPEQPEPSQGPAVQKGQKTRESTSLALGEHGGWRAGASRALSAAESCVPELPGRPLCRHCLIIHNTPPCLPCMLKRKLVSVFHLTIICKSMTLIHRLLNIRNLKFTKKDLGLSRSNIFKGKK